MRGRHLSHTHSINVIMPTGTLLDLRAIRFKLADGRILGPVNWDIEKGDRIALECRIPEAYRVLVDVISAQLEPLEGYIEELERVVIQTDTRLKEVLSLNQTAHDILNSGVFPDSLWLENKRRSLWVVIDRLGLTPRNFHLPIKLEPPEIAEKVWALHFIASRADLLIGREIFMTGIPEIRTVLKQRWGDFTGTVICAAPDKDLPGPVTVRAVLDATGAFHYDRVAGSNAGFEP